MSNLLFERKVGLGMGLWIYDDMVIICNKLGNKTSIPISKIASVECNIVGTIRIETTGGKSFDLLLGKYGADAKCILDNLIL